MLGKYIYLETLQNLWLRLDTMEETIFRKPKSKNVRHSGQKLTHKPCSPLFTIFHLPLISQELQEMTRAIAWQWLEPGVVSCLLQIHDPWPRFETIQGLPLWIFFNWDLFRLRLSGSKVLIWALGVPMFGRIPHGKPTLGTSILNQLGSIVWPGVDLKYFDLMNCHMNVIHCITKYCNV